MEQTKPSTVASRIMEFVTANDGPSAVAKRLGKHPQFLYNIRDGKAKPSFDTLGDIMKAFPGKFDLMYVMTGTRQDQPIMLHSEPSRESEKLAIENESLKRENVLLRDTVSMLRAIVGNQLGADLQSKAESTDGTTQGELFGLNYMVKKGLSFTPSLDIRDAKSTTTIYPNQAPQQPPRRQ